MFRKWRLPYVVFLIKERTLFKYFLKVPDLKYKFPREKEPGIEKIISQFQDCRTKNRVLFLGEIPYFIIAFF